VRLPRPNTGVIGAGLYELRTLKMGRAIRAGN
jgi:hypothetical protein